MYSKLLLVIITDHKKTSREPNYIEFCPFAMATILQMLIASSVKRWKCNIPFFPAVSTKNQNSYFNPKLVRSMMVRESFTSEAQPRNLEHQFGRDDGSRSIHRLINSGKPS